MKAFNNLVLMAAVICFVSGCNGGSGPSQSPTDDGTDKAPTAIAVLDTIPPYYEGESIRLNGSYSHDNDEDGAEIVLWEWDWNNDGDYDSSGPDPVKVLTFENTGVFTIQLQVTDDEGESDVLDEPLEIEILQPGPLPIASARVVTSGPLHPGISIEFDASASRAGDIGEDIITEYAWDFDGDGEFETHYPTPYASHVYQQEGTYNVQLKVMVSTGAADILDVPIVINVLEEILFRLNTVELSRLYFDPAGVELYENYVFSIGYFKTLISIFDLSDPARPIAVNWFHDNGRIEDLEIVDGYAYVACGSRNLFIYDVHDVYNPVLVGELDIENQKSNKVVVWGEYAFLEHYDDNLYIVDITDPQNPYVVETYNTPKVWDMAVSDGYAYLASTTGLFILEINPPNSTHLVTLKPQTFIPRVVIDNDLLYFNDDNTLNVYNIENPLSPFSLGSSDIHPSFRKFDVKNGYLYDPDYYGIVHIIDVSDVENAYIAGSFTFPEICQPLGLAVNDEYCYVGNQDGGLSVLDVSDPELPQWVGNGGLGEDGRAVKAIDNLAYLADGWFGFYVIDIANPNNSHIIGSCMTWNAVGLDVSGDYAYVADDAEGLKIIDITNPENPFIVYEVETAGPALNVILDENYAYVAAGQAGLQMFNIENPATAVPVFTVELPGSVLDLDISGDIAYVVLKDEGIGIVEIDPIEQSHVIDIFDFWWWNTSCVSVSDNWMYIGADVPGFLVADISSPEYADVVTFVPGTYVRNTHDFLISGNYAYVVFTGWLGVIEIYPPGEARFLHRERIAGGGIVYGIDLVDNYAFLAGSYEGFHVVQLW